MDEEIKRAGAIQSIKEKPRKYVKTYNQDETEILYLSPEKVMDEFDVEESEAEKILNLAVDQSDIDIPQRKDLDVDSDEVRLMSEDPNSYWNRVKRGFSRQKKAWLVPGNFIAGVVAGAFIELWYVQVIVAILIAGDIVSAWFHGRLDIDD